MSATLSGGFSGFFGAGTLPIELPIFTTLLLRSIAEQSKVYGFDPLEKCNRIECLFVLALGSKARDQEHSGYWAVRGDLDVIMRDATTAICQRSTVSTTAPALVSLSSSIASRFGVLVSERVAARSIPIVGALTGSTINFLFVQHFRRMAAGHFIVLALEKKYGQDTLFHAYLDCLAECQAQRKARKAGRLARARQHGSGSSTRIKPA